MFKVKLSDLSQIIGVVVSTVEAAEVIWSDYTGAGEAKKEYVVNALNKYINIPFIGESLEAKVLGLVVDIVVELVINAK